MEYEQSIFYKLQSKKRLKNFLFVKRDVYCEENFINSKIKVFLQEGRIIEAPDPDIQVIQRNILRGLNILNVPDYLYSGVRQKGYKKCQEKHDNKKFLFSFDIKKFFYNTSREKVYNFFKEKLQTSNEVAEILTIYSTIDLGLKKYCGSQQIKNWVEKSEISQRHLIAGAPQSVLLSFLVNNEMYEELNDYAQLNDLIFSSYVDDFFFSSDIEISQEKKDGLLHIINKYGYHVSENKIRYYIN